MYDRGFNRTLAVLPVITAGILLAMQCNLVISLGIVAGTGLFELAFILALLIAGFILLLDLIPVLQPSALLVIGADDDWILNPMNMDDTKVREKVFTDLWNELAAETPWDDPMSTGEYVELVQNGSYQGLYLLQRRIDAKYLGLQEEMRSF